VQSNSVYYLGEDRLVREVMDHRLASPGLKNPTEQKRVTTLPVLNEQGSVTDLLYLVEMAASVMSGTATALLREIRNSQ